MAKVKTVEASYGTSVEFQGVWHKFQFSMALDVEDGDNVADVKSKLWNTVVLEVQKQIEQLVGEE